MAKLPDICVIPTHPRAGMMLEVQMFKPSLSAPRLALLLSPVPRGTNITSATGPEELLLVSLTVAA